MENLYQTQQLVIDLRHARETDACRRRLVRADREPVTCPSQPDRRHHHLPELRRFSLARG
jgi:hypothetical protein